MTDTDIIKALEFCIQSEFCEDCIYRKKTNKLNVCPIRQDSLDLINRQKAEIERLHNEVKEKTETITFLKDQAIGWSIDFCNIKNKVKTAKSEAIREFAERLKPKLRKNAHVSPFASNLNNVIIDNLVKEMTEGEK